MSPNEEPFDHQLPSTHWSSIRRAADQADALERLLSRYRPAFLAHLTRKRRLTTDDAEDVLQGFLCKKFIETNVLGSAAEHKGRFRNFILTVLDNYLRDEIRRRKLPQEDTPDPVPESGAGPAADPFDTEWARGVLSQTLEHMRGYYEGKGTVDIWEVFELRILEPTLNGRPLPGYDALLDKLAFESPEDASNALMTAKRGFRRIIRDVIGGYASSADEIEEELRDLYEILARQ